MEIYNISRYTFFFATSKDDYLVYNSRMNSFFKLSKSLFDILSDYKINNREFNNSEFDNDLIQHLLEQKIVVKDKDDDIYVLEQQFEFYRKVYSQDNLKITLAPTTACNFKCPYCFEKNKKSTFIKEKTILNLVDFINDHENAKKLYLTWYGGEPLLAINQIDRILTLISEKTNLEIVHHNIITNGYLFDKRAIAVFKKFPLNSIQITLDGLKDTHDESRILIGSEKGSFDTILNNIHTIISEMPETYILIRVNIDNNNREIFSDVWNFFYKELKINTNRLSVYPGFIKTMNSKRNCWDCTTLSFHDKKDFYFDLQDKKGINVHFYPNKKDKGCIATQLNGYVVGPEGELYRCWYDVGNKSKVWGHIQDNRLENKTLFHKYMITGNCFADEECKKCAFLPICNGGCPNDRVKNLYDNGQFNLCTVYKDPKIMEKCLERYYEKINE